MKERPDRKQMFRGFPPCSERVILVKRELYRSDLRFRLSLLGLILLLFGEKNRYLNSDVMVEILLSVKIKTAVMKKSAALIVFDVYASLIGSFRGSWSYRSQPTLRIAVTNLRTAEVSDYFILV